jgi:hypothetical protein
LSLIFSTRSRFSAQGDSQRIKYDHQNTVTVCFTPQREGLHEAVLELHFYDHKHKVYFMVKRKLIGRATIKQPTGGRRRRGDDKEAQKAGQPPSSSRLEGRLAYPIQLEYTPNTAPQPINDRVDDDPRILVDEEFLDCDGTGISVSRADGLDFGIVERKRPNGPFATPSSLLTIKHDDDFPAMKFIKGRTKPTDRSDRE